METKIPVTVARCPECQAQIKVHIMEWTAKTKIPTRDGCYFRCTKRAKHEEANAAWKPVLADLYAWVRTHCRVEPFGKTWPELIVT